MVFRHTLWSSSATNTEHISFNVPQDNLYNFASYRKLKEYSLRVGNITKKLSNWHKDSTSVIISMYKSLRSWIAFFVMVLQTLELLQLNDNADTHFPSLQTVSRVSRRSSVKTLSSLLSDYATPAFAVFIKLVHKYYHHSRWFMV